MKTIRQWIRELKCRFRGHRMPSGYSTPVPPYQGTTLVACERCGRPLDAIPLTPPPSPVQPPDPTPEPTPAPPSGHICRTLDVWFGPSHKDAVIDERFALKVTNNGRNWTAAPSDWRTGKAGAGCPADCNVMCCAAYRTESGKWVGGKFDWNRPRPADRDWKTVKSGYKGWRAPAPGTEMVCWCYTEDGGRVSLPSTSHFI